METMGSGKYRSIGYWVLLFFPFVLSSCTYTFYKAQSPYPQAGALKKEAFLPEAINETSGLEVEGSRFLTFNDSGGEAALYTISRDAELLDKTIISNTLNADWEAIADDESYYYIADVGNNFGRRDTLSIYKVLKSSLRSDTISSIGVISFSYDEEVSNNKSGWYSHDCESIFAYGDSLYLHAKDWVNMETRLYVLPKEPGHYEIKSRQAYQVKALITGSDIYPEKNEVVLVGYRNYMPVIIKYYYNSDPGIIEGGGKARIYPFMFGTQTEAVAYDSEGRIYVTSEKSLHKQAMYRAY